MDYRIKRGEEEFGPYSLGDLQRYVQTGNVLPDDLAMSEGMAEWIPVSQVLGDIPVQQSVSAGDFTGMEYGLSAQQPVPLPPNLHWAWLLLILLSSIPHLGILAFFGFAWRLVQANWARKLSGSNTALVLSAMFPIGALSGGFVIGISRAAGMEALAAIGGLLVLGGWVCMIIGIFKVRSAMEEYYNTVENIGLSLSGAMTFFFSVIYIQFHINRIARWKKTGYLS